MFIDMVLVVAELLTMFLYLRKISGVYRTLKRYNIISSAQFLWKSTKNINTAKSFLYSRGVKDDMIGKLANMTTQTSWNKHDIDFGMNEPLIPGESMVIDV